MLFSIPLTLFMFFHSSAEANALPTSWRITKAEWTESDERNYSNFVQNLGNSKCKNFDSCLKSPANPYRKSDPAGVRFFSDCADFPYMLRAYFAWKNGLPFSLVSGVAPVNGKTKDIRYSMGNYVTRRTDFFTAPGPRFTDAIQTLKSMANVISSAMFRYHPQIKNDLIPVGSETLSRMVPDFYPVKIERGSVRPGTVVYDPAGHVLVVYKIEEDGRIALFDAHPDNSITHTYYTEKFGRSNPAFGAGFKNFRPLKLIGAKPDAQGNLIGGKVFFLSDAELADYDVTQYFGTEPDKTSTNNWKKGTFSHEGSLMGYYEWVRTKMAGGNLRFHPVTEMKNLLQSLCQDLGDRVLSIEAAVKNNIHLKPHPERLPLNIYGSDGEWEEFSTPSRDARLKVSYREVRTQVQTMVEKFLAKDPKIDYAGTAEELRRELLKAYVETVSACKIRYTRSDKNAVQLNLENVRQRLYALSFDPYHCPELRWGASSAELATCKDDTTKLAWYKSQQRLRNQLERTYTARMDFSLSDLNKNPPPPSSGVDEAPDTDVLKYLKELKL